MKTISILNGIILIVSSLILGGCYTMLEMRGYDNYGHGAQNYQNTPADSNYGSQYQDQEIPDSMQEGAAPGNYNGYPPDYGSDYWYGIPRIGYGYYWGMPYSYNYVDPFCWDPWGYYSYNPYFNSPLGYYGAYLNPYYYGYYGNYYGYYNGGLISRTGGTNRTRNENGLRNGGGRGNTNPNYAGTTPPTTSPGNVRSTASSRTTGRGYSGRSSRQQYYPNSRRIYTQNYNRSNSGNRNTNKGTQPTYRRSAPPRTSGSYSAPRSSGGSYSAPRMTGGSSSGRSSSGGGSSSGRRR